MTHVQAMLATGGGGALVLAVFAGWREAARKRRVVFDAVGLVSWPTVQFLALVGAAACAWLALKGQ